VLPVLAVAAGLALLAGCADSATTHWHSKTSSEAGFVHLFGRSASDGWAQCGPGFFTLTNNVATAQGGMGLWWYTNRAFTNFVVRGEWVQEQFNADSGVFLRFPAPGNDPWNAVRGGHEMEIGDDPEGKEAGWRTGAIYPFSPPVAVPTHGVGRWNAFEITCVGQTYRLRVNGQPVNDWTDPQRRTSHGYIGLQNYNDGKTVRFRDLRIKALP
jgi:hypothetical protein